MYPLQSKRSPRLELVKSEVSQDSPPAFLTHVPLGIPLESDHERSILYSETAIIRKRRPAKRAKIIAWLLEELSFTMNKMSLAGLVFGLMVLGTLFFVIGFLAAVTTLSTPSPSLQPQTSWSSASTAPTMQQTPQHPGLIGRIAGKLIRDEAVKVESKMGGGALGGAITQHVPAPLQPFAQQAQNKLTMSVQQNVNKLASAVTPGSRPQHPFHPNQQAPTSPQMPLAAPHQQQPLTPTPPPHYAGPNYAGTPPSTHPMPSTPRPYWGTPRSTQPLPPPPSSGHPPPATGQLYRPY
ncbi:MAG TPA: hypothetical protein VNJ29_00575 [Candidatus Nitrosotenuis sp.]|jgi:hypothetical protein|nr:hypothetical protein [Candidatus Nitrosotenuis sp.]